MLVCLLAPASTQSVGLVTRIIPTIPVLPRVSRVYLSLYPGLPRLVPRYKPGKSYQRVHFVCILPTPPSNTIPDPRYTISTYLVPWDRDTMPVGGRAASVFDPIRYIPVKVQTSYPVNRS